MGHWAPFLKLWSEAEREERGDICEQSETRDSLTKPFLALSEFMTFIHIL